MKIWGIFWIDVALETATWHPPPLDEVSGIMEEASQEDSR